MPLDLPFTVFNSHPETTALSGTVTLTFKSLKPAHGFTLAVSPSDAISTIKQQLSALPRAPPADAQRLLLKGKALADSKLLTEYPVKDGDTLTLAIKPGVSWDPNAPASSTSAMSDNTPVAPKPVLAQPPPIVTMTAPGEDTPGPAKRGHTRIPSVVLSPSPSSTSPLEEKPADIPLTFDTSGIPTASEQAGPPRTTYHATIADPDFWLRLYTFLKCVQLRVLSWHTMLMILW